MKAISLSGVCDPHNRKLFFYLAIFICLFLKFVKYKLSRSFIVKTYFIFVKFEKLKIVNLKHLSCFYLHDLARHDAVPEGLTFGYPDMSRDSNTLNQVTSVNTPAHVTSSGAPEYVNDSVTLAHVTGNNTTTHVTSSSTPDDWTKGNTTTHVTSSSTPDDWTKGNTITHVTSSSTPDDWTKGNTITHVTSSSTPTNVTGNNTPSHVTSNMPFHSQDGAAVDGPNTFSVSRSGRDNALSGSRPRRDIINLGPRKPSVALTKRWPSLAKVVTSQGQPSDLGDLSRSDSSQRQAPHSTNRQIIPAPPPPPPPPPPPQSDQGKVTNNNIFPGYLDFLC